MTIATRENLIALHALKAELEYLSTDRLGLLYRLDPDCPGEVEREYHGEVWCTCCRYSAMGLPDKIIEWASLAVTGYSPAGTW